MIKIKERLDTIKVTKPAKAGIFYITTSIFTKLLAFLATPLFTRLLLPDEYGVYSLYISWMGIISVVLALGISGGAIYRSLARFKDRRCELVSSAVGILLISGAAALSLTLIFGSTAARITGLSPLVCSLLVIEVFFGCAETVIFAVYRYKYSYVKICLINLLYAILSVGTSILLISLVGIKAEARIYASFFARLVLILPLLKPYLKPRALYKKEMWKYLLKLSLPLLPSAVSSSLIAQMDKLMIRSLDGSSALGKYSIAYSVGFMLSALTSALYSALQPWLMRKLDSGNTAGARAITKRIIFLSSLGLLVFLLVVPEIFRLVAARAYRDAELAVYPLAIASYLQFISNILAANIIHSEKTWAISVSGLISFGFNLLLNLIFIPIYGYFAAAFTTARAYFILTMLEYFYLKKLSRESLVDSKTLYPLWLILLTLPIYFMREIFLSRFILSLSIILAGLPSLMKFIKAFLERRNERAA